MGFQSKLLIMLLAVSVSSVLTAGVIGYLSGTNSLRNAEYQRLTELRESRSREITNYYGGIATAATVLTHSPTVIASMESFAKGFEALQTTPLPPGAKQAIGTFFNDVFDPALEKNTGKPAEGGLFLPKSNAQSYLQALYMAPAKGDRAAAIKVTTAGDPSAWTEEHARSHEFFADFAQRFAFDDAMLIDTDGNVVYSVAKEPDLGANVLEAPLKTTQLAGAYGQAMRANSADEVFFTDFEFYGPGYGRPTQWVLTPIGDNNRVVGVLAMQLSANAINNVMTGNRNWEKDGLGKTGETFLVGPDKIMRSDARLLLTDPEKFAAGVIANGTPEDIAKREVELKTSVLLQPLTTSVSVGEALAGNTGVRTGKGITGPPALSAYAPLDIPGLQWAIVARVDESEALAPVSTFARNIALSTAAIVLAVSGLALLFARILTRPVKTLSAAVQRVTGGELGVRVPVTSRDEFGDLSAAFNDMSNSLQTKQMLIDEQSRENDALLASLMPETVARRYREGEENISTQHRDVSVIYSQMLGFDDFSRSLPSEESVVLLTSLVAAFDDAAERHGVEQVRSMQDNGLLATCGLVVPRVDHASRTIAFGKEINDILRRFNDQHDSQLTMRIGIDSGPVTSGLVGERSTVYALWGEAVDLAHRVHAATRSDGIFVSDRVHQSVVGIYPFTEAGTITGPEGVEKVWQLEMSAGQPA
jgi:class 3 adenylate cyclase